MKKFITILAMLLLVSCQSSSPSKLIAVASETAVNPLPTKTSEPISTATTLAQTPKPKSTRTNTPTIESTTTSIPLPVDPYWQALQYDGYSVFSSGSFADDLGQVFSVYVFTNTEQSFFVTDAEPSADTWRLVFYQWNGVENVFLGEFPAPTYNNVDSLSGYPLSNNVVNWEDLSAIPYGDLLHNDSEAQVVLHKKGFTSDVNQNGLPEFAVSAVYCPFSCSWPEMGLHFFEIQADSSVTVLTYDLPGRFAPDKHPDTSIVHITEPLNFYVDEHFDYYPGIGFDVWWIYEWDVRQFVDVTHRYAGEYQDQVQMIVTKLAQEQGKPYSSAHDLDMISIPFILDKPGLREEALTILLEVSNPDRWPGTAQEQLCWLELVRAFAQEEYQNGKNFAKILTAGLCMDNLAACLTTAELSSYDLSSCHALLP